MLNDALTYLKSGLQVLPAAYDKRPLVNWKDYQKRILNESEVRGLFEQFAKSDKLKALGFLTGNVSGGLEVIDVDTKYDLTGNLYAELKSLIDDNLPDLVNSLVICQTRSGGYHIYYRCSDIAGNQKLARRPTTPEEQEKKPGEKVVVLIETRGEGGFIVASPTPGYTVLQGSFESIPTISPDDRNCLLSICKSFNEEPEQEPLHRQTSAGPRPQQWEGLSPFADYNQRGDILGLLERHLWTVVGRQGQRIHLKRPGQSDTKTSGNFHEGLRKLFVFSSSTEFEPEKAYSPADAFILLECRGDKKDAYRRLLADGYGTAGPIKERVSQVKTESIKVEATDENGEGTNLTAESVLTEERIKSESTMRAVYIYFTQESSRYEVLDSLALLERTSPVKIYLVEVASLNDTTAPIQELRPSEYKAQDIINRYAETYTANNGFVSLETEDAFIEEFITIRQGLTDPFEVDRFRALWLKFSEENNLSITLESIKAVEEKLTVNKARDEQNQEFSKLLETAADLQRKGKTPEALKLLSTKGKELNSVDKSSTFKALTTPIKEADIASQLKNKPDDIRTGYLLGDTSMDLEEREVRLPAGAISIVAGPTSHGKTAVLLNLALKAASELPNKNIYVLGYEENGADMVIRAMNAFIAATLSANNRRSISSHYKGDNSYFKGNSFIDFSTSKEVFFETLISPGKLSIQYVDYDSDTLVEAIHYLHKHGNAGGVFVDYMQLLRKPAWKSTRQEELKQICLDLKDVAVETGLPITLAAQFNRKVINPLRMHPTEIGEAGDIERIANVIIGIWNNDKKMLCTEDETEMLNDNPYYKGGSGKMYFELLKNRGGRPDLAGTLGFDGNTGVISNESRTIYSTNQSTESAFNPFG